ncbi:MAG: alcohol dehydrogenase family protein [Spirochaetales bacterium]|nr:alcohol dehydrogenase family protein [Spirochaetales bacterium]
MKAVVTTGNGGYDKLEYRDVPVPELHPGEVLVRVLAAGVNNTEINTRLGWYSAGVSSSTEETANSGGKEGCQASDGGWNAATPFPFIQGTDCCGVLVQAYPGEATSRIGLRGLIRPCMRPEGFGSMENIWMASDFDGAFAQFVAVPASEFFPVHSNWTDAELGSIPCAYGTAENMIHRAKVAPGTRVLVAGASGGVGSAAVQLAKRRGAIVTAIAGTAKMEAVAAIGADMVIPRGESVLDHLGEESVDVVIDNVGGTGFPAMLRVLKRGGCYVSSGAIGGPIVELDLRTWYLKDIRMIGCTAWDEPVFFNLISYIEKNEIRPVVAGIFPLEDIVKAQKEFMQKHHVGKLVLIPPSV